MTFPSSLLYCNTCGAANQAEATYCFACGESLRAPVKEPLLKQRYRLLQPIGQGGFGAVYKAEDTQYSDRLVAIKELNLSNLTPQEAREATEAFQREVSILSGLTHPNLPRMYDHFTAAEHWYLVLEFIEGETLEQYLDKTVTRQEQQGTIGLPIQEVLDIGLQLCRVLDYLHNCKPPIIFRDLKPANVMRTAQGQLYLIDFGIARHFKLGQAKDTMPLGSPGYAAPEQYGRAQTTPQADIYSLGAMLHQLLTGDDPAQTPFRFSSLPAQNQTALERFQSLLLQMVDMDINNRPASIAAVKETLENIAAPSRPIGTILTTYEGHSRLVLAAAWAPDSQHIASASYDGTMQVWNAARDDGMTTTDGSIFTHRNPARPFAWVWTLAWSPDSRYLAAGSDDKTVRIWRAENKEGTLIIEPVLIYRGHTNWVNAVAWSPNGFRIASASDDKTVQVWHLGDTSSLNKAEIFRGHSRWVNAVAWSPDGNFIASGSNDTTIHVWQVASKETILTYKAHKFGVTALAWSPDGTRIASCSLDTMIRVWDPMTGNTLLTYRGHTHAVNAIAWSPDGRRIASASKDKTVRVWEAIGDDGVTPTGKTLLTYRGHTGWVYAVSWSPDGTRIASGGNDKTVQVWQASTPNPRA